MKAFLKVFIIILNVLLSNCSQNKFQKETPRERISINKDWKFFKYKSSDESDNLYYDVRPIVKNVNDSKAADTPATEAEKIELSEKALKPYILPTANPFIKDSSKHHRRPKGNPGSNFHFVQNNFNDSTWEDVTIPHDWAITGPFQEGKTAEVTGGMGRLPSNGVAWYRKTLKMTKNDKNKSIYLDVDGIMSYAMVWLNGNLVGGWPYGYNSWRLDLTPYLNYEENNLLAIRVDNPNHSARWYPGAGIYRNIWLTKTNKIHVSQWGTTITAQNITKNSATINYAIKIDNDLNKNATIETVTDIFYIEQNDLKKVATLTSTKQEIKAKSTREIKVSTIIDNPKLWGPPPTQSPNLYKAITTINANGKTVDIYETTFGIRSLEFDPNKGILVNGELIKLKGVNEHHDLGALGAAFNVRAAERKLEILKEMGCNAIRMAHNPPAPEFLDLCDKMGFLVIDEIFDSWERKKTPHDFHLIFPDWYEADTRAMVRRDKNHPSIILWSYGNEVGEQYTGIEGASIGKRLVEIIKDEDPTRLTTSAMNWAKSDMPFPTVMDVISFNYQGEGIRQDPIFEKITNRIKTKPQYEPFHKKFPNKVILSSETASAASSRGIYLFPVTNKISAPMLHGNGKDDNISQVSAYELYAVDFGSSPDKVFTSLDKHPYSAGEFVWTGFDYLGEPTPYYNCRSSYNGILDLAGFPKDRYYLYQARWRPNLPMVHILPHWNWDDRLGKITPVHVITSGDAVELFLNGKSLGIKEKGQFEYRLRWDDVIYEKGELKAVAYKNNEIWAEQVIKTTGKPARLQIIADRTQINANGKDLSYLTVRILDENELFVANATNEIEFNVEGAGKLIATDNGNPCDMTEFNSSKRKAFSGLALGIIQSKSDKKGLIKVSVSSNGLESDTIELITK